MEPKVSKWLDRFDILNPEDKDVLEANSAIHEFRGGVPREEAEDRAYSDYLKNHALESCAYHYLGMKAAVASGHSPAAKKHGEAYSLGMKHLGLNPLDSP